jgi:hypothetical protein
MGCGMVETNLYLTSHIPHLTSENYLLLLQHRAFEFLPPYSIDERT